MFVPSPILRCYEALEQLAQQMLDAARADNWDAVAEVQRTYVAQVERLRHLDHDTPISEAERSARFQRLERILACDAAIRHLLMPEMAQLGRLLGSSRRQKDLHAAYRVAA
jgi:flagellar protein FliT